jgi:hypothetical protein
LAKGTLNLKIELDLQPLSTLQFHYFVGFSQGQVLGRIVYSMLTILDAFKVEDAYWYHQATTFLFHDHVGDRA